MKQAMSRIGILLAIMALLALMGCKSDRSSAPGQPGPDDVRISDLAVKSFGQHTTQGELWFSAKAMVHNNTSSPRRIEVDVQGVDQEGFELEDVYLRGDFSPNESKILTNRDFMPEPLFNKVIRWQVRDITYGD